MITLFRLVLLPLLLFSVGLVAQDTTSTRFQAVPELGYSVVPDFFKLPIGMNFGEASAVALNSKGHIFVFHRSNPMLIEFDERGKFQRSIGEGLFDHPHGLRIDADDNIWTTDDGNHLVLKLNSAGRVLLVLGRKNWGAEADWLFNRPTDVAFGKNGEIFVSDGYSNSRIVKFDRQGNFIKSWGKFGTGLSEFSLPHSIVIDAAGRVYVADRENMRIQIFDQEGNFLEEWTDIGYPYGLFVTRDQHIWMADGGFGRVIELDQSGKILGALGEPGRAPGQFGWAHMLALGPDGKIYVADILNWRFQVFAPSTPTGQMTKYVPTVRKFWDQEASTGWLTRQKNLPKK